MAFVSLKVMDQCMDQCCSNRSHLDVGFSDSGEIVVETPHAGSIYILQLYFYYNLKIQIYKCIDSADLFDFIKTIAVLSLH